MNNSYEVDTSAESILTIDLCTGIQDILQKPQINIYPNPSSNSIILTTNNINSKAKINIYDLLGKIVYSEKIDFSSENQSCKIGYNRQIGCFF